MVFYFYMNPIESTLQQISRYIVKKPQIKRMFFGRDKVHKKMYFLNRYLKIKIKLVKNRPKPYRVVSNSEVEKYAEDHLSPESEVVTNLIRSSDEELAFVGMLSRPLVEHLLQILVQTTGAKYCIEIGTFTGYSAIKWPRLFLNMDKLIPLR